MAAVRFAVVGTNWITSALIEAGRTVAGFDVSAVMSRSADTGRRFADAHGLTTVHTSLAQLAADPSIDAVYVASPNSLHAGQTITLLEAGKHVLAEKPLGANAEQVAAMDEAADAAGRMLMEAYVTPFQPNAAAIREGLGRIGPVRRALLVKDQYSSRYDRLKAGEVPNAFNPAFAAGSLMDLGYYPVSLAVHLFGEPESVTATGVLLPTGVDGQGTVLLEYAGFEVACLHSKIAPGPVGSRIAGEGGAVEFDDCSVPTHVVLAPRDGTGVDLTAGQSALHMRYEVQHFLTCVEQGLTRSPAWPSGAGGSLSVLRILDEARRQTGVRFDSDR